MAVLEHKSNHALLCPNPPMSFHHMETQIRTFYPGLQAIIWLASWSLPLPSSSHLFLLIPFCFSEAPRLSLSPVLGAGQFLYLVVLLLYVHEVASFLAGRCQVKCHLFQKAFPDTKFKAAPQLPSITPPCSFSSWHSLQLDAVTCLFGLVCIVSPHHPRRSAP